MSAHIGSFDADVLVAGGGPVGAALALALAGSDLTVAVLEARPQGDAARDVRTLVLSYGSRLILQRLGVWPQLQGQATPIHTIHVSSEGHWGRTIIQADDLEQPALGYVLPHALLSEALARALQSAQGISLQYGSRVSGIATEAGHAATEVERDGRQQAMTAALLVLADGGNLLDGVPGMRRRVRDYGQSAVVAQVESEQPHHHVAYERFTPAGPMALLPNGERAFALVWSAAPEQAQTLCGLAPQAFLDQLGGHFGGRAGRFSGVAGRAMFPLRLSFTSPPAGQRLAVVGNAAQTLHPVAGQGLNLGLRDAWTLAQLIRSMPRQEIGGAAMLARYRRLRWPDRAGMAGVTDFLATAFSCALPGMGTVLGMGIGALELAAPARNFFARRMSFGLSG